VGYDAVALEAHVEAHYCMPYTGGEEYAQELIEGDIHLKTTASVFYEQVKDVYGTDDFHKDHPIVKPWRHKSKTVKYSATYGAQAAKIAKTIGIPEHEGQVVFNRFWEAAKPLAELKDALTRYWELKANKAWIKAIDGRRLMTRSKHSLVNTLFQSCGAIAMDYSAMFMDKWLGGLKLDDEGYPCYHYKGHVLYRVLFQHDEFGWDCPPEVAEEIGRMGCKSITAAGKYLKMRVPLLGDFKIGRTWRDTH
jgi:DNA polymerase-1